MNIMVVATILALAGVVANMIAVPAASADNPVAKISNLANTTMPGCEGTDHCFDPSTIIVDTGAEIVWSNDDTAVHTITSGALRNGGPDGIFDSGLLGPGATFSHAFSGAGEYPYFCILHPWMAGMVTVQDPPTQVTMIAGGYDPVTITVDTGREVVWVNDDLLLHTVTSGSPNDGGPDGIFNSGPFTPGTAFSHAFTEAGEYPYFCVLHPWLTGRVVVQEMPGSSELPEAQLTLDPPATQVLEGDSVLISGRLATSDDQESTIAGQTVLVREESTNATLITLVTDDDGMFGWVLTGILQGSYEVYVSYEGGSHDETESARYSIVANPQDIPDEPSISSVTLGQIPEADHTGEPVVLTGSLTSGGSAVPNRVIWMYGGDDPAEIIGYGVTDAQGNFAVQWMRAGLPEADLEIYAAFGGDSWYAKSQSPNQTATFSDAAC